FRKFDELVGIDEPSRRMAPAEQGLERAHLARLGDNNRLIMQLKLIARNRFAQLVFQTMVRLGLDPHARLKECKAVPPFGLGLVQGEIGHVEESPRLNTIPCRQRYADAGSDGHLDTVKMDGLTDNPNEFHRQGNGTRALIAGARLNDRELITPKPR